MIDREMKVAQEGIRLPQSLKLDVVIQSARGRGKRCTTTSAAVATEFVRVEMAFGCEGLDKGEKIRVRDPLVSGERE